MEHIVILPSVSPLLNINVVRYTFIHLWFFNWHLTLIYGEVDEKLRKKKEEQRIIRHNKK